MTSDTGEESLLFDILHSSSKVLQLSLADIPVSNASLNVKGVCTILYCQVNIAEKIAILKVGLADGFHFAAVKLPVFIEYWVVVVCKERCIDACHLCQMECFEYFLIGIICLEKGIRIDKIAGMRVTAYQVTSHYHPAQFQVSQLSFRKVSFEV